MRAGILRSPRLLLLKVLLLPDVFTDKTLGLALGPLLDEGEAERGPESVTARNCDANICEPRPRERD